MTGQKLTSASPEIIAFMGHASANLPSDLPPPKDVFALGDKKPLQDELLGLVFAGTKTATTTWPLPKPRTWEVGDLSVLLDGDGNPAAMLRTVELVERKFNEVDEQFALDEGEDDMTLESWRTEHTKYFTRIGQAEGVEFRGGEQVVLCERFEVLYPPLKAAKTT